ncbi:adenosine kinase [Bacteroidota bacterium]
MEKVLGMGNALVDIMTRLESDELLEKFALPKGSMQLVDKDFSDKILNQTSHLEKQQSSGGSAANTIHGLSNLGVSVGFVGKTGKDRLGQFFNSDLEKKNIHPILFSSENDSGRAIALVSPDSERTFATYLGASIELSEADLSPSIFEGYKYFHIEGYLVQNHDLFRKAVRLAKENYLLVSLDMASYNVVEENRDFLNSVINEYIDIVFANEEESKSFTGLDPEQALNAISEHCEIAVVKLGKDGSLVKNKKRIYKIGATEANCIDTTGAGDLYAAGFLYGLVNEMPLNKCGELGAILGSNVIEVMGAKMDDARWNKIKELIKQI